MTTTFASKETLVTAARAAALKTKAGRTITGEQIRARTEATGIIAKSPSTWGSVIQALTRQGILEKTADTVRTSTPQARGRKVPVYTRLAASRVSA